MIKVKLTENYAGVNISGDYEDLDELYNAIHYLIKQDPNNEMEESMQNHLYGFLYDVRHAYQGDRDIELIENGLSDYKKEYFKIKKIVKENVYFSFNYVLPDLILDMVLIKYFIRNIDKKESDIFNPYINLINLFYAKVLNSLSELLTPVKFNKMKKGIIESVISDTIFFPQWFEVIICDYLNYDKNQRVKHFTKTMAAIYDYSSFIDYIEMKLEIEKYCEENNCRFSDVRMCDYPEKIDW